MEASDGVVIRRLPPTVPGVQVDYRGAVTLGASGRARLHEREGGINEMVWEALGRAGWIGEMVGLRTMLFLPVRVGRAPEVLPPTHSQHEPLPGRARHRGEKGWIDQDEMVCPYRSA